MSQYLPQLTHECAIPFLFSSSSFSFFNCSGDRLSKELAPLPLPSPARRAPADTSTRIRPHISFSYDSLMQDTDYSMQIRRRHEHSACPHTNTHITTSDDTRAHEQKTHDRFLAHHCAQTNHRHGLASQRESCLPVRPLTT